MNHLLFLAINISFLTLLFSCKSELKTEVQNTVIQKKVFHGETQGTTFQVIYYDSLNRDFIIQIQNLLSDFNKTASLWDTNSLICKVNNAKQNTAIDSNFKVLFLKAQQVSDITNGNFDCTVGNLVNAWGFGFKNKKDLDETQVKELLKHVGYKKVSLRNDSLIKPDSLTEIDFNALAQGYSVDIIAHFLEQQGIRSFLVEIGGEVKTKGTKPDSALWTVSIEKPYDDSTDARHDAEIIVQLKDKALATSGNYRRFYIKDNQKYAHTINPFTGYPVQHHLLSASVITDDCMDADAFATAFMVMGTEESIKFINQHPELKLDVFLIYQNQEGTTSTYASEGFKKYIKQ